MRLSLACLAALLAVAPASCARIPAPSSAETAATSGSGADALNTAQPQVIASGLDHPWAVAPLPDGTFLVTERPGRLRRIDREGHVSAPIRNVPAVHARGQGGLLDVVLDPAFADNQRIWLSYSEPGENGTAGTAVATATLGDTALSDLRVLYRQLPKLDGGMHFGSRIAFDGRGHVFISQGERNQKELAQDLDVLQGKLVRLRMDGSIPTDNPFASGKGLPCSWVSSGAISPARSRISAAARRMIFARSMAGVLRQVSKPLCAAASARSRSAMPACATRPISASVAGLSTGSVRPSSASRHWPSMRSWVSG